MSKKIALGYNFKNKVVPLDGGKRFIKRDEHKIVVRNKLNKNFTLKTDASRMISRNIRVDAFGVKITQNLPQKSSFDNQLGFITEPSTRDLSLRYVEGSNANRTYIATLG